jgi:transcriptional regulator with XRE-family HTH domain
MCSQRVSERCQLGLVEMLAWLGAIGVDACEENFVLCCQDGFLVSVPAAPISCNCLSLASGNRGGARPLFFPNILDYLRAGVCQRMTCHFVGILAAFSGEIGILGVFSMANRKTEQSTERTSEAIQGRIAKLCKKQSLGFKELALKAGCNVRTVRQANSGKAVFRSTVCKIAQALGVSPQELTDGDSSSPSVSDASHDLVGILVFSGRYAELIKDASVKDILRLIREKAQSTNIDVLELRKGSLYVTVPLTMHQARVLCQELYWNKLSVFNVDTSFSTDVDFIAFNRWPLLARYQLSDKTKRVLRGPFRRRLHFTTLLCDLLDELGLIRPLEAALWAFLNKSMLFYFPGIAEDFPSRESKRRKIASNMKLNRGVVSAAMARIVVFGGGDSDSSKSISERDLETMTSVFYEEAVARRLACEWRSLGFTKADIPRLRKATGYDPSDASLIEKFQRLVPRETVPLMKPRPRAHK